MFYTINCHYTKNKQVLFTTLEIEADKEPTQKQVEKQLKSYIKDTKVSDVRYMVAA